LIKETTSAFWDWAVEVYSVDAVKSRLLAWQYDYDVVILELLYVLWLAHQGRVIGESDLLALHRRIRPWIDNVVLPLRQLRQQWTGDSGLGDHRSRLLMLELEAERQLAGLLQNPPMPDGSDAMVALTAAAQLDLWCAVLHIAIPEDEKQALLSELP